MKQKETYEIMHGEIKAAQLDTQGLCRFFDESRMPCHLYLEEGTDIDTRIGNLTNFYYWCSTRLLTLDRRYAKELLGSIGASQASTDRDRAQIALSYHCLTLTDIYWVKKADEDIHFHQINLYENHLDNALVELALRGRMLTVENSYLICDDLSTSGCFPKAWLREADGFILLKDGAGSAVENELLASKICRCFDCGQVLYEEKYYDGQRVSACRLFTSLDRSIVTREAFEIYALNHGLDPLAYILDLDAHSYHMMNILDYLVGNTDRHWGNWGLLIDNHTGQPISLHPLMDFNQAFHSYDTLDGANCQTVLPRRLTQREAAREAVRKTGLCQIRAIEEDWFSGRPEDYRMFCMRRQLLEEAADTSE